MKRLKILITGQGFLGGYLVKELEKHRVFILTNDWKAEGENIIKADIRDRATILNIERFDVIYHLAGILGTSELNEKAYEASQVNIAGTVNMLDLALKHKAKFINITKPNVWLNTYSITKQASEDFTRMYHKEFNLPTVSIKWFNVYGPNQSFHVQKAIPYFIKWALGNEEIQIWGDGEQTGDYIHAKDAVRATVAIANEKGLEGTTVDVGSGRETTVNHLAEMILYKTQSKSQIAHYPMRSGEDAKTRLCANTKALEKLGFKESYSLNTGLDETIEFYKNN